MTKNIIAFLIFTSGINSSLYASEKVYECYSSDLQKNTLIHLNIESDQDRFQIHAEIGEQCSSVFFSSCERYKNLKAPLTSAIGEYYRTTDMSDRPWTSRKIRLFNVEKKLYFKGLESHTTINGEYIDALTRFEISLPNIKAHSLDCYDDLDE